MKEAIKRRQREKEAEGKGDSRKRRVKGDTPKGDR